MCPPSLACREQPQHVPAVCGGVVNCHCCDMFMMHGRITGYGVPTVLGPSCRHSSAPNAVRACNQQGSTSGETIGVHVHRCVPGAYGVGNCAWLRQSCCPFGSVRTRRMYCPGLHDWNTFHTWPMTLVLQEGCKLQRSRQAGQVRQAMIHAAGAAH